MPGRAKKEGVKKERKLPRIESYSVWKALLEADMKKKAAEKGTRKSRSPSPTNEVEKEKKPKGPPVLRSTTGLSRALEVYTSPSTSNLYERHGVHEQCRAVLGPPTKDTICWLC